MQKQIALFTLLISGILFSQKKEITSIREYYNTVNNQIKNNILYENQIIINKNLASWRAVGIFYRKINFFYTDDPTLDFDEELSGINVLKKVELHEKISAREYRYQMLFKNGKLIFLYKKDIPTDTEYRYYFLKGKLIRYMKNNDIKGLKIDEEEIENIKNLSSSIKKMFLAQFLYQ